MATGGQREVVWCQAFSNCHGCFMAFLFWDRWPYLNCTDGCLVGEQRAESCQLGGKEAGVMMVDGGTASAEQQGWPWHLEMGAAPLSASAFLQEVEGLRATSESSC